MHNLVNNKQSSSYLSGYLNQWPYYKTSRASVATLLGKKYIYLGPWNTLITSKRRYY